MLLMIGGAGGALRWTIMAFDPPAAALPWLQMLHAASFGTSHLGALAFVSRAAPPGLAATAQGYLSIAMGAVMAAAMGLSGVLYANFGSRAYAAMALAALAGGVCAAAAHRIRREAAL
jgi:PPP family 3-phenylpropionic acid transporter